MSDQDFLNLASVFSSVHALPPDDEEETPINVLADSEASRIPWDQSPALLFVRRAIREHKKNELGLDGFLARIEKFYVKASKQLASFTSDVERVLPKASPEARDNALLLQSALQTVLEGADLLLHYGDTQDFADIDAGMALIETGFMDLDEAEERADEATLA